MNKKYLLTILLVAIATTKTAEAACANRTEGDGSSNFSDDVKCTISSAGDSISRGYEVVKDVTKETVSSVTSSDTFSSISSFFSKGYDAAKKAASKTGEVLTEGYKTAVEKTKEGYQVVKDTISGKPASEFRDGEGVIDVRGSETEIIVPKTP